MEKWNSLLKADPLPWLLEPDNPSVRYFALKDLADRPEQDREVIDAGREIMLRGAVPRILEKQRESGYWETYPRFYTDKYKGLVWQLIVLAEHGARPDEQIKSQCEYMLNCSAERENGGFAVHSAARTGGGRISEVIPCLTGNMVWVLIRFGYLGDPRLQMSVEWLNRFMRFNDGLEENPQVAPYDRLEPCWGRHTCHMGVVKALKALAAIPEEQRSAETKATVGEAAEFLLVHRIYKKSHDWTKVSKPGWLKLGFPLMYQTDILEVLDILTGLGIKDSRMDDAVEVLLSKQDENGRWNLESSFNDRFLVPIEKKGAPGKWITLRAARVLKRYRFL